MKLTRLRVSQVRQFRGTLEVPDFDPGLNLFFGPNETGKSTVVRAIRAAFLERHRSLVIEDLLPRAETASTCSPTIELQFDVGGQEQFYLEGQISLAVPQEGGEGLLVHCSTQHPSEMQQLVAHALGWAAHRVVVQCRRMGGGFGGKESQSALFACVASLAALKLKKPVKLRVDRDDDFLITGRRHGFDYRWNVGFDDEGRLLAAEVAHGSCTDLPPARK